MPIHHTTLGTPLTQLAHAVWSATLDQSDLVQICQWRAERQPSDLAYTFLADGETDERHLTYGELDRKARAIAVALRQLTEPGERALLIYEPGLDYIAAFFGCLYANVIAVPVYPPDPMRTDRTLPRLQAIMADARANVLLCTAAGAGLAEMLLGNGRDRTTVLATDDLNDDLAIGWNEPEVCPDRLAYLQYTSGSTGDPKGVMISHRNLIYNVARIERGVSRGVVGVTWLPTYHDFGLVGAVVLPMYCGRRTISMSPMAFVQRPLRWLEAITRYKGTCTGAPNFSYDLCVRKSRPEEREGLDLSSLTIAMNGAEPVRQETMDRFCEAFAPHGFRRDAFVACYGLAEATLGVTGGISPAEPTIKHFQAAALAEHHAVPVSLESGNHRTLVSCGPSLLDTEVMIVDPETRHPRPANEVGEIWVRGPGVAHGYWNRPEDTEQIFNAYLATNGDGPYLRTGDLGFVHEEEIYVTGRLKDMVIFRGRNHYPQDIELTAQRSHPSLKPESVAAFSVEVAGEERLVVVQEVLRPKKLDLATVTAAIRAAIVLEHEIPVYAVVLIQAGTISKTTSGKIQRRATRQNFLDEKLNVLAEWRANAGELLRSGQGRAIVPPRTRTETRLLGLYHEVLGIEEIGIHDNFFDLGGHSLLATQLVTRIRTKFLVDLPLRSLFTAPTVALLAPEIETAVSESPTVAVPSIRPVDRRGEVALSCGQQRLWFMHHLLPEVPLFNLCLAVRIRGEFDAAAMQRTLAGISHRHESLRTTFTEVDGRPVQTIADETALDFERIDLTDLSSDELDAEVERLSHDAARCTFDLATGPLWRTTLVMCRPTDHVLLIAMHHIVSDGWSLSVLLRELLLAYEAETAGRMAPFTALEVQYADYAAWQKQALEGPELGKQLDFWRATLGGAPAMLALPTDRPRPVAPSFRGATAPWQLSPSLTRSLEDLSRKENVTLFMTLLAGLQTVLARYSGQNDICVGTAVANRTRPELEGIIGFFVNTLVMRGDLSDDPTFRDLLARTRQTALAAYENQDVPFERLVDEIAPRRDVKHSPLFQVALVLQNQPWQGATQQFQVSEVHNGTAKYDLTLQLWKEGSRLVGTLECNTDLFDAATAERLLRSYELLLTAAIAAPDERLSQLPLVDPTERQRLLVEWNETQAPFPSESCLYELFEEHAQRTPNALAAICGSDQITYGELNRRANRLARHLQSCGVGPDTIVGLCFERSIDMLVGMWGILKAGGAYLPLDPNYPASRLELMLRDAEVPVLVTNSKLLPTLPRHDAQAVLVDRDAARIATQSDANLPLSAGPRNLAYVIYTSGSTGQPKGVLIEHRAACNMTEWYRTCLGIEPGTRALQFASLNFDASAGEILSALTSGATLVIPTADLLIAGPQFVDLMNAEQVEVALLPPSFLAALPADPLPHLHTLIVAGEACTARLVDQLAPGRRMLNGYGPTEGTVGATWGRCRAADNAPPSIGRPFPNVRIYLLDQHQQPVPLGAPGEIYIGGVGVARGYLNRPELTAKRFLADPYSSQPGARMYRTGDLARHRADGTLEYLGRTDGQVKIRGFRIELEEIETVLGRMPGVQSAVVVACDAGVESKRLVAYIVSAGEPIPTTSELHRTLMEQLPDYMVPSAFVLLPRLPLTPNGKIDRAALPAPQFVRPELAASFVAPSTPAEETLARIWAETIGIERVGIHDNFFELGGDSLMVMQVVSRANQAGLRLQPRQMFEHQTVAEQAAVAGCGPVVSAEQGLLAGEVPLAPIQHWFFEQDLEAAHHFNQSLLLEVRQKLNPSMLEQAVGHLLSQHDALRLRFEPTADGWRQSYSSAAQSAAFSVVNLASLPETEQGPAIEATAAEMQTNLDLSQGPLIRVALFDLGANRPCRLLVVVHHLAVDGVSWRVLLSDLQAVYQQLLLGQPPNLPPKTTSYREWTQRLAAWTNSTALVGKPAEWRDAIPADIAPLPRDAVAGTSVAELNTVGASRTVQVALTETDTRALLEQTPRRFDAKIDELLLAALAEALLPWTSGQPVLVDLEGHGREDLFDDIDLSRTVGWFTSIRPVVLRGDPHAKASAAFAAIRDQLRLDARRGLSFLALRYLSNDPQVAASMQALPQAEISFNYLGQIGQLLSGGPFGLALESSGPHRDVRQLRRHLIEFNGMVVEGRMQFEIAYCEQIHDRATVERLAAAFAQALAELATVADAGEMEEPSTIAMTRSEIAPPLAVAIQPQGSQTPLFCMHPAGGNVFPYYGLAHRLGADQPVYGLQARGLEGNFAPHDSVEAMASEYVAEIRLVQPLGPYRLAGWSFGGLVAYEMACQLTAVGQRVEYLGLIDTRAAADDGSDREDAALTTLLAMFPGADPESVAQLQQMSRQEQLDFFARHLETSQLAAPGSEREQARRMFDVFEANAQAWLAYRPQPYAGDIELFRATQQTTNYGHDAQLGWGRLMGGRLTVQEISGSHLTIVREPHVRTLAARLMESLASIPCNSA